MIGRLCVDVWGVVLSYGDSKDIVSLALGCRELYGLVTQAHARVLELVLARLECGVGLKRDEVFGWNWRAYRPVGDSFLLQKMHLLMQARFFVTHTVWGPPQRISSPFLLEEDTRRLVEYCARPTSVNELRVPLEEIKECVLRRDVIGARRYLRDLSLIQGKFAHERLVREIKPLLVGALVEVAGAQFIGKLAPFLQNREILMYAFLEAAKQGNRFFMESFLELSHAEGLTTQIRKKALCRAAHAGRVNVVEFCLEKLHQERELSCSLEQAVIAAAHGRALNVIQSLFQRASSVKKDQGVVRAILSIAAENGDVASIEWIFSSVSPKEMCRTAPAGALWKAAYKGQLEAFNVILRVSRKNLDQRAFSNALCIALYERRVCITQAIIGLGEIELMSGYQLGNILVIAARQGNLILLETVLRAREASKINVAIFTDALDEAMHKDYKEILQALLKFRLSRNVCWRVLRRAEEAAGVQRVSVLKRAWKRLNSSFLFVAVRKNISWVLTMVRVSCARVSAVYRISSPSSSDPSGRRRIT